MTPLEVSLVRVLAAATGEDWVLIGSAAARLSGVDLEPQDVDVLASRATIEAMAMALGGEALTSDSDRFRSTPFVRIDVAGGLPIELMGDLHVYGDGWRPLTVTTRIPVETKAGTVYVPGIPEQIEIFERFGRPKDLAKAHLLRLSGAID